MGMAQAPLIKDNGISLFHIHNLEASRPNVIFLIISGVYDENAEMKLDDALADGIIHETLNNQDIIILAQT